MIKTCDVDKKKRMRRSRGGRKSVPRVRGQQEEEEVEGAEAAGKNFRGGCLDWTGLGLGMGSTLQAAGSARHGQTTCLSAPALLA